MGLFLVGFAVLGVSSKAGFGSSGRNTHQVSDERKTKEPNSTNIELTSSDTRLKRVTNSTQSALPTLHPRGATQIGLTRVKA